MLQNYLDVRSVTKQQWVLHPAKTRLVLLSCISLLFGLYVAYLFTATSKPAIATPISTMQELPLSLNDLPPVDTRVDSVATVVAKALYFKSLLNTTQQATLQQTYTTTLARKWSNLPCGSGCRNGIQFGTLTSAQLAAALDVIRAASGTGTDDGYNEFQQVRLADKILQTQYNGGSGYDSTIFFISFLNTPTTTGAWMLQFGGHHYAANIAYNGGKVVGGTPYFMGVEPTSFTLNSVAYTPLKAEHDSFAVMLASLTSTQLNTVGTGTNLGLGAKLSTTYGDCYMIPGETNGGNSTFPAKAGLLGSNLTTAQKSAVYACIKNYTADLDDSTAAVLQDVFQAGIDNTYIGYTGSGTSGSSSTFLNANTNYVRLDGPRIWLEFICQNGAVIQNQIHYHTVLRDHARDYGVDLTATTLPLSLLSFDATAQAKSRLINWATSNESSVNYYELQRSSNPSASFETVARLNAKNGVSNSYTYTDNEAVDGNVIYYRLNMVDGSGRSSYSNIVAVKYSGVSTGVSLYPNPAKDVIIISNAEAVTNATISIINSVGKTVLQSGNRSGRNLNVDIANLPAGSYMVQVSANSKTTTLKFVKQR